MSTIYRAAVHCDVQGSGRCHGLLTVAGEPQALPRLAAAALEAKGWRRTQRQDACPACLLAGAPLPKETT